MLNASHHHHKKGQAGLSLVELMVGLVVGLLVMLAATTMFITTSQSSREATALARLSNENVTVMNIMTNEIRRAGASAFTSDNFYMRPENDLLVSADGTCILFSYDRTWSANSASPAFNTNNFFGFRLNGQGQFEMRTGGTANASNCNSSDITWTLMTNPDNVNVEPINDEEPIFEIIYECINTDKTPPERDEYPCKEVEDEDENVINNIFLRADPGDRLLELRSVHIRYTMSSARFNQFSTQADQQVFVRNSRRVEK